MADNFTVVTDELHEINQEATNIAEESKEPDEGSTTETEEGDSKVEGETASPETEEKTEAESQEAKEGHSRFQKRIDKLTRQREEAFRENEALKKELEAIKSLPKKEATKKLDPLDFESYEDYIEALNSQPKQEKQEVKEVKETKGDAVSTELIRKLDDAFEDAREKYKDFDEVTQAVGVPFSVTVLEAISELEHAGEVAYYFAKNREEALSISKLSPYKMAIELSKLEAKVTAPKPVPEKKVTKAPEPIQPVQSGGDVVSKDPSKMSFSEYETYMNAQTRNKKGFW